MDFYKVPIGFGMALAMPYPAKEEMGRLMGQNSFISVMICGFHRKKI